MEESMLLEILKEMQKKYQRTIDIDKHISTRIAGTHSFYN